MRVARRWRNARSCVTNTHRARVVGEEILEPRDRVDVEMVRRLVEQQEVRLRHQRPCEQDAAAPAAGEGVDDGVGGQAEAGEHQLDALLEAPAVALLEFVLEPARAARAPPRSHVSATPDGGVVVRHHEVAQVAEALGDHVEDREVGRTAARPDRDAPRAGSAGARPSPNPAAARRSRMRRSVDLPLPLRPTTHTRSPASNCAPTSSSSGRWPKASDTRSSVSRGTRSRYRECRRHGLARRGWPRSDHPEHDDRDERRQQGAEQQPEREDRAAEVAREQATGRPGSARWRSPSGRRRPPPPRRPRS